MRKGGALRLVVKRSRQPIEMTVRVASEDRPVRIIEVEGPLAKAFALSAEASRVHSLHLVLDTSKANRNGICDIKITTDHPEQAVVTVALLLTDAAEGGDP